MATKLVSILGGTGFVGTHLVNRLRRAGIESRVLSRHPQRHRGLQAGGGVTLHKVDPKDEEQIHHALVGSDAVINLVGILNEGAHGADFRNVHVALPDRVVAAARRAGIRRLLHMSALNANESHGASAYLTSKGEAENRVHTLGKPAVKVTSFRPSVIFGPGDSFINRFDQLLRKLPGPFPLACPHSRFAPVYVSDVVEAFLRALDDKRTWDQHYDLCGPEVYTLEALVRRIAAAAGISKPIIALGDGASRLQARVLGKMPGKPFSYDNYLSLQTDSICNSNGLERLGIEATAIDSVLPYMLTPKASRRRYSELRRCIR
ncbi:MAG: complex I NDUFA9 subunit family protein [Gammaproteobacteria bacterium]|nr:complex I NDUFA9 subunit family protein [Gammaproteobacteria bacterium]